MARFARTRRSLAASLAILVLLVGAAAPAFAADDLIVQPGDTLWDIASRNGTTVSALVELNGLANPSLIVVGQRIVLRPAVASEAPAAPPAPSAVAAPIIHVVLRDETLWGIAAQYGTTVAALVEANQVADPSFIRTGQTLVIPQAEPPPGPASAPTPGPAPAAAPAGQVHVVQPGETLWAISVQYGTSVAALAEANDLADPSFIRTGQQLVIPGAGSVGVATAAPGSITNAGMSPLMAAMVMQRTAGRDLLLAAAREFGVSGPFVLAVAWHESGWQPDAVSWAGAVGLMQLMPATAEWVAGSMLHESAAIDDPRWNARAGVRLLAFYLARYQGDTARTLAAYFQGMASVEEIGILESTRPYVDSILALEGVFSR